MERKLAIFLMKTLKKSDVSNYLLDGDKTLYVEHVIDSEKSHHNASDIYWETSSIRGF